jgi:hypothetical protein
MYLSGTNDTNYTQSCGKELMGSFGILTQGALALLAFSTLIFKRLSEPIGRRRNWKIWFADTTKQVLGATVIHFLNIAFAKLSTHDQCTWYFINYLLDSTVGLLIIYVLLKLVGQFARIYDWSALKSGDYGTTFQIKWWLAQCLVYLLVTLIEKFIVITILQIPFWDTV